MTRQNTRIQTSPFVVSEDIEPRILYSADAAVLAYVPDSPAQDITSISLLGNVESSRGAQQLDQSPARHLVVLDGSVDDLEVLVDDLAARQADGAPIDLFVIDPTMDGIYALSDYLGSGQQQYSAVHLISHGDAGEFQLGSQFVTNDSIRSRAAEFSAWAESLTDNADLLIYGCELGATGAGRSLVDALAVLTTADVAASDNSTGHGSFNGDWLLEVQAGDIEAGLPFSTAAIAAWQYELNLAPGSVEQRLNTTTDGDQSLTVGVGHQIASNDTQTVVVWHGDDAGELFYRVFQASDPTTGTEQLILNNTDIDRDAAVVAMSADGSFMVAWTGVDRSGSGTGSREVFAQRFSSDGSPIVRAADAYTYAYANPYEFRVNPTDAGGISDADAYDQFEPSVTATSDGGYVVTWTGQELVSTVPFTITNEETLLSRYDASGLRVVDIARPFVGSTVYNTNQATFAVSPDGSYQVVAAIIHDVFDDDYLQLRSVDNTGQADGQIALNFAISGVDLSRPSIAVNDAGQVAVMVEANNGSLILTHLEWDGTENYTVTSGGTDPDIVIRSNGDVIAAWHSGGDVRVADVALSAPESPTILASNTVVTGSRLAPSLAFVSDTSVSAVWSGDGPGDASGVFIRNFNILPPGMKYTVSGSTTDESGTAVTLSVALSTQPIAAVQVQVAATLPTEAGVSASTLLFNPTNWDIPQQVVVTGLSDGVPDGDQAYAISLDPGGSLDTQYGSLSAQQIPLTNLGITDIVDLDPTMPHMISEVAAAGSLAGITVSATHTGQTVSYVLITPGSNFQVESSTGVVSVAAGANLTPGMESLTIEASSTAGASVQRSFSVTISDANNNPPVIDPNQGVQIPEHFPGPDVLITPSVTDADTLTVFQDWTITGGSGQAYFSIDPATGEIRVADPGGLDYEVHRSVALELQVTVSDGANTSAVQTILVTLTDINDNKTVVNPNQVFSVAENSPDGTLVGTIQTSDLDTLVVPLNWTLVGGSGSADFVLDPATGAIRVSSPGGLDVEALAGYTLTVTASDDSQVSDPADVAVNLVDTNEAPLGASNTSTVSEDRVLIFSAADFIFSDPDAGDGLSAVQIASVPNAGQLFLNNIPVPPLVGPMTVSVAEIQAGLLTYRPPADFAGTTSFSLQVADAAGLLSGENLQTILVQPVNDVPVVSGSLDVLAAAGETAAVGPAVISASDQEDGAIDLIFRVDAVPLFGELLKNGNQLAAGQSFTQADLLSGQIAYRSVVPPSAGESFTVSVSDSDGATVGAIVVTVNVGSPVFNDPGQGLAGPADEMADSTGDSDDATDVGETADGVTSEDMQSPGSAEQSPSAGSVAPPTDGAVSSGIRAVAGTGNTDNAAGFRMADEATDRSQTAGRHYLTTTETDYDAYRVGDLWPRDMAPADIRYDTTSAQPGEIFQRDFNSADWRRSVHVLDQQSDQGVMIERRFVASSVTVSTGLTIGYVLWLLRGGALLSSVLASMPAWRSIDPLPVLSSLDRAGDRSGDSSDDDSLQGLLRSAAEKPGEPAFADETASSSAVGSVPADQHSAASNSTA
ncbi:MAG: DUF4347 domain-containing protein [Burkholderiaceae bacterium]